jgi:hypothetical protein
MLKHELHARTLSRFAVKVVKAVRAKSHPCNPLMVNAVKPSQGKSNQLPQRVKVAAKAAKIAGSGSGKSWRPRWQYLAPLSPELSFQLFSCVLTYSHLFSLKKYNFFVLAVPPIANAPNRSGRIQVPKKAFENEKHLAGSHHDAF